MDLPAREYAKRYLAAKTDEEKKRSVKGCPEHLQGLVRTHVRIAKMRGL